MLGWWICLSLPMVLRYEWALYLFFLHSFFFLAIPDSIRNFLLIYTPLFTLLKRKTSLEAPLSYGSRFIIVRTMVQISFLLSFVRLFQLLIAYTLLRTIQDGNWKLGYSLQNCVTPFMLCLYATTKIIVDSPPPPQEVPIVKYKEVEDRKYKQSFKEALKEDCKNLLMVVTWCFNGFFRLILDAFRYFFRVMEGIRWREEESWVWARESEKKRQIWLAVVALGVVLWFVTIGWPNGMAYSNIPLKVKNSVILLNVLTLPLLSVPRGWMLAGAMGGMTYGLGVRTGAIAFILALLAYGWAKRAPRTCVTCLALGMVLYGLVVLFGMEWMIKSTLLQNLGQHYPSFYERLVVWEKVNELWRSHFWWGLGPSSLSEILRAPLTYLYQGKAITTIIRHPHNLLLELKASFGFVGYLLMFGSMGSIFCGWIHRSSSYLPLRVAHFVYAIILWSFYLSFFRDPWFPAWIFLVWAWTRSAYGLGPDLEPPRRDHEAVRIL